MIQPERVQALNAQPIQRGDYVLYWMQQSQRAVDNHALAYAIDQANELGLPVVVCFGLTDRFPEANLRHFAFMLQGLRETGEALREMGVEFVLRTGNPPNVAQQLGLRAAMIVCDQGCLRIQRQWRSQLAENSERRVVQVESDVVVPVEAASNKEEYAAATLRPKIHRLLDRFLVPLAVREPKIQRPIGLDSIDWRSTEAILQTLDLDRTVPPVAGILGGHSRATARLADFLSLRLEGYADQRNDPAVDQQSGLSPYLHFGQISPLTIALKAMQMPRSEGTSAFLEELIVRRELACNFTEFNPNYDRFDGLPDWCRQTLQKHESDARPYLYEEPQLEAAQTHDPYWNAAMTEMKQTGKMHGYMRMYWGKKILEWTDDPKRAFEVALRLNNKYFLDGRDPNSFCGVAWCFGKHDRPWAERPIFGTVRYMNANGLRRKFDIDAYVRRVMAATLDL